MKSYKIQSGDTFTKIAKKFYNDSSLGTKLGNYNKSKIRSKNIDLIYPGESVDIPDVSELKGTVSKPPAVSPSPATNKQPTPSAKEEDDKTGMYIGAGVVIVVLYFVFGKKKRK